MANDPNAPKRTPLKPLPVPAKGAVTLPMRAATATPAPRPASKRPPATPSRPPPLPLPTPPKLPLLTPPKQEVSAQMRETSPSLDEILGVEDWDLEEQRTDLINAALAAPDAPSPEGPKGTVPPPPQAPSLRMPTADEVSGLLTLTEIEAIESPPISTPPISTPPISTRGQSASRPPPPPRTAGPKPPPIPPKASGRPAALGSVSKRPAPPATQKPAHVERTRKDELVELLQARIANLSDGKGAKDPVALARGHLELALADEALADGAQVVFHAEKALAVDPEMTAAHAVLRRARHARPANATLLKHLDRELTAASSDATRADLLAERARLLEASGEKKPAVRAAWEQALAIVPDHPGALKGLEAVRATATDNAGYEELATHLARMADAYRDEKKLAAWLHVERAQLLDKKLGQVDAAWGALTRALELDPGIGPVRNAAVRHASLHKDAPLLVSLLDAEARIDTNTVRSARLELDAACIAMARLADPARALGLLERAAARAPTAESVDRRVLDELVRIHEAAGRAPDAVRVRRARLTFVSDPRAEAHELRTLAALAERLGDLATAIRDIERAMSLDPGDATLTGTLDRLLTAAGKSDARVALWANEAERLEDPSARARALVKASEIAEAMGKKDDAIAHVRAAWIADPTASEVLDRLTRLLTNTPSDPGNTDVRARIALYAHAADRVADPARRLAYKEKIALLWEEVLGEHTLAAKAYEDVLAIEPGRRGALLGLQRTAARAGDGRALARALLDEAEQTKVPSAKADLMTRAAAALTEIEPDRALALAGKALELDAGHVGARAIEVRMHEQASRWELAARAIGRHIEHLPKTATAEKVALWLARAELEQSKQKAPTQALASLKQARALDPKHPVPPEAIARQLEAMGDDKGLCAALEQLAADATTADERARHLVRAAEIDENRLGDDAGAAGLYARALAQTPSDDLIVDRLVRVLVRVAPLLEVDTILSGKAHPGVPAQMLRARAFERAVLLLDAGTDMPGATKLIEQVLDEDPMHVPALRMQEAIARATGAIPLLANALSQQADAFVSPTARLGSLWALAALVEWKLPASPSTDIYARILKLAPTDRDALDAILRRSLRESRAGDSSARARAAAALRALLPHAGDDTTRLAIHLELGLLLDGEDDPASTREALEAYGAALALDPLSVTAATGAGRLATALRHTSHGIRAATSLAELARDPRARARFLLDAAELLLGASDSAGLGTYEERRTRAADLLEKALESDPESVPVAGRLATVRAEDKRTDRLVESFRVAIRHARAPESIVMLGSEISRLARTELKDPTVAIDAMQRVREVAPKHVPSLLTLAELYIAARAWPEAVEVLESVVQHAIDPGPKLTALFALASLYEKVVSRASDVERVLRAALELDPTNARALRGVIRLLRASPAAQQREPTVMTEIANLLERLAESEPGPDQKQAIYLELCDMRASLGDRTASERALVEAAAQAPTPEALRRLAAFHKTAQGQDIVAYARALTSVVTRAEAIGRADASWLATLGQLEVETLDKKAEGIAHLRKAVAMAPQLHETRLHLASALARSNFNAEAADHISTLLVPDARPLLSLRSPPAALDVLERALAGDRRTEEALVARELRAVAGALDDAGQMWLRARRHVHDPSRDPLDRSTLMTTVLPPEGRHLLLHAAVAGAGVEAKVFRTNLSELGISARDCISSRSGHPLRLQFDRVMRALQLEGLELVLSDAAVYTKVVIQDTPWIVAPPWLAERGEPAQVAAFARAMTRVALGAPWAEELPPPHVLAYLTALARQGSLAYASDLRDRQISDLVLDYEPRVANVIARRQRKQLQEIGSHLDGARAASVADVEAILLAIAQAELRVAFLLTGDLLATLDEVRAVDSAFARSSPPSDPRALGATLMHPLAGDVARYALTREATALRRRIGSAWG
jgi:cellulose synthase operon protein C